MKLINLIRLTDYIRKNVQPDINIQQIDILFRVAHHEGIGQQELMSQTGLMSGSVSRHLMRLGRYRNHTTGNMEGLGLVMQTPDPESRRNLVSYLTPAGKEVIKEIQRLWDDL